MRSCRHSGLRAICCTILMPSFALAAVQASAAPATQSTEQNLSEPLIAEIELAPLHAFHHYAHTLHELTERRRSTVHFPNQQSILRGAQVGFVNVGDGNLSLARRDLIVVGMLPIVVARLHDSSAIYAGDFGPGWQLSIAETISLQDDGSIILRDESGSAAQFISRNQEYVQAVPHPTDIVSFTRNNSAVFTVELSSGIAKRYRLIGGKFRLSTVTDRNGNSLRLHYNVDLLARIDGQNGRFVIFDRDSSGRISKVTDEQGANVKSGVQAA